MKVKHALALATAALAFGALPATAASAEEASAEPTVEVFAGCAIPAAEQAYLLDPSRTMQEIHEAWAVNRYRYCAGVVVPAAVADNVAVALSICMDGRPQNLGEMKECVGRYERGELAVPDDAELARMMRSAEAAIRAGKHPSKNHRHLKRKRHHRGAVAHASAVG